MKVVSIVFGALGVLVGAASISGSLSILIDDRDADDFFISDEQAIARSSFAVTSGDVDVLTDAPGWLADWLTNPVDVRVRGASSDGGAIFFGIAESSDLEAYLAGVNHDEVTSLDFEGADIRYGAHQGNDIPTAPGLEGFWVASVEGPGEQVLDWSLQTGNWSLAVMNADASAGIDATLVFGATISNFVLMAWIGFGFGVFSLLGGGYLLYRGLRRESETERTPPAVDLREGAESSDAAPARKESTAGQ
jgi:hypothetical protein